LRLYSDSAFIIDKHGQIVFYPWRPAGKGYVVPNDETRRRLNKLIIGFIWTAIFLIALAIFALSTFGGYFICISTFFGVPANLLVLYFLIVEVVTKNLSVYPLSYKDLILDNISSDDEGASKD